jgi:hypothetical protein
MHSAEFDSADERSPPLDYQHVSHIVDSPTMASTDIRLTLIAIRSTLRAPRNRISGLQAVNSTGT